MSVRDYKELSTVLKNVTARLLSDQELCKLLYYNDYDPLSHQDFPTTSFLLNDRIRFTPTVKPDEESKCSIVMVIAGGNISIQNQDYRDVYLHLFIYVPYNEWVISGDELRPFLIMSKVESLLKGKEIGGFGRLQSEEFELALSTEVVAGYRMAFKIDVFS